MFCSIWIMRRSEKMRRWIERVYTMKRSNETHWKKTCRTKKSGKTKQILKTIQKNCLKISYYFVIFTVFVVNWCNFFRIVRFWKDFFGKSLLPLVIENGWKVWKWSRLNKRMSWSLFVKVGCSMWIELIIESEIYCVCILYFLYNIISITWLFHSGFILF